MDIKIILFGIIFLSLIAGLFYFITLLLQKIMVKIHQRRNDRYNNIDDYSSNDEHINNNHCGIKTSKAILEAKKKMRGK